MLMPCPAPLPGHPLLWGRRWAAPYLEPSTGQAAMEVGTAGAQGRLVPLLPKSCSPPSFCTILPAKPHPHPITSPACHPSAYPSLPKAQLGWDSGCRDRAIPQWQCATARCGSTDTSPVAARQQLLHRLVMTHETALIQHNTCPGVPHWNGNYCPHSPTLELSFIFFLGFLRFMQVILGYWFWIWDKTKQTQNKQT